MARVSIEDCLKYVENRFALVSIASDRARRLMNGSSSLINTKNKEVVTALREIAEDLVVGAEPGTTNDEVEQDQTTYKKDFAVEDRFMDDDGEDKIEYSTTDQNDEEDNGSDDNDSDEEDEDDDEGFESEYVEDDGSDDDDGNGNDDE